ncbi:hypothetical protein N9N28_02855 [Rubripirellula amarantea]|nr:hypothetical protein [Rubripirellula amarantea]
MLMRNPDYAADASVSIDELHETTADAPTGTGASQDKNEYSSREILFGQIVLALLFVIAILLRWST